MFWHFSKNGKNKAIAVMCDGIGGLEEGEEASSYVVRQLANWFMTEGYKLSFKKQKKRLQQLCYQIHQDMKCYGEEKGIQLGTTMTCVLMQSNWIIWAHYGDCRLYLLGKRKARILTEDHTYGGKLIRALGVGEWHLFSYGKKRIKRRDQLLLCTDGLYRNLKVEELDCLAKRPICNDAGANRILRQLLEKKKQRKEQDNISALYFGYAAKEGRRNV